jgi:hypothetical protein
MKGAKPDDLAFYIGATYWREWNSNRWGEAVWRQALDQSKVRLFLPQSAFALEFRVYLP